MCTRRNCQYQHKCPVITHQFDALVSNISEYEKLVVPLWLNQFEHELSSHLDKTFVAYVLSDIQYGFDIGYNGLQIAHTAPNLASAFIDPSIIDVHLRTECNKGHMAGPLPTCAVLV